MEPIAGPRIWTLNNLDSWTPMHPSLGAVPMASWTIIRYVSRSVGGSENVVLLSSYVSNLLQNLHFFVQDIDIIYIDSFYINNVFVI